MLVSFLDDDDPRVREMACRCQEQFISVLKKSVVPVLKTIIGPWWLAQYQLHSSAATAAKSSFQNAFPAEKRRDVLRLCSQELFSLLRRRILPKQLALDKATKTNSGKGQAQEGAPRMSDDEQQRVAEALEAFSGFVGIVHGDGLTEVQQNLLDMLDKKEFWALSKFQHPRVRQAFFGFVKALWESCDFVGPYLKESSLAVTGIIF